MQRRLSIRRIARRIARAADRALDDYREERVTDEPNITDRILGAITENVSGRRIKGLVWTAATLRSSSGEAAEESRHGADLIGVLDVNIPSLAVTKGFLAQAKRAEPDIPFTNREWHRLQNQCDTMLERTPDSFVIVYSRQKGIRVIPAIEVVGSQSRDIFQSYDRSFQRFFEQFLECFVGDRRLNRAHVGVLDELAGLHVMRSLKIEAREA